VGEFLILLGTFETSRVFAVLAALGIILGAVYMLWLYQRMMFGELTREENRRLTDLSGREIALLVPIVVLMFWIGIYPNTVLRKMDVATTQILEQMRSKPLVADLPAPDPTRGGKP
jgi:NADH-quinone oxidoreductase subunit M